jgi:hypothetical protein
MVVFPAFGHGFYSQRAKCIELIKIEVGYRRPEVKKSKKHGSKLKGQSSRLKGELSESKAHREYQS